MNEKLATNAKSNVLVDRLIRRNPFVYGRALKDLERWDSEPIELLCEQMLDRVASSLRSAGRTTYGRAYAGLPLEQWPILEKETLRSAPDEFYGRSLLPQSPGATSGTTGKPLSVRRSLTSVAFERAVIDRSIAAAGADPYGRYVILRGDNVKSPGDMEPPFCRFADGGRGLIMSSNHVCASTAAAYAAAIAAHAPAFMIAYPTSIEALTGHCSSLDDTPTIPVILTQAEVLSPGCRRLAEEVFGSRVVDEYGQAERVAKANSYAEGSYRFVPGYAFIELLPTEDQRVWEIVGTSLGNAAMPLVRYRTGDSIELLADPTDDSLAEVRLGRAEFKRVIGRSGDYTVSPDGVRLMGMDHIPRGVPHILQSQLIQNGSSVRILVVPGSGFSRADEELLMEHARLKIPPSMSVDIEIVPMLTRTRGGKAPFVIRMDKE